MDSSFAHTTKKIQVHLGVMRQELKHLGLEIWGLWLCTNSPEDEAPAVGEVGWKNDMLMVRDELKGKLDKIVSGIRNECSVMELLDEMWADPAELTELWEQHEELVMLVAQYTVELECNTSKRS